MKLMRDWIDALRNGKFKQGKHFLERVNNGEIEHCCLGVLCRVAGLIAIPRIVNEENFTEFRYGEEVSDAALPETFAKLMGFADEPQEGGSGPAIVVDGAYYSSLAEANDRGVTFEQIADALEERYFGQTISA